MNSGTAPNGGMHSGTVGSSQGTMSPSTSPSMGHSRTDKNDMRK
jgi:hypothetical protein